MSRLTMNHIYLIYQAVSTLSILHSKGRQLQSRIVGGLALPMYLLYPHTQGLLIREYRAVMLPNSSF